MLIFRFRYFVGVCVVMYRKNIEEGRCTKTLVGSGGFDFMKNSPLENPNKNFFPSLNHADLFQLFLIL